LNSGEFDDSEYGGHPADVLPVRQYCFRAETFIEFFCGGAKAGEPVDWTFLLITRNDGVWTEAMLIVVCR